MIKTFHLINLEWYLSLFDQIDNSKHILRKDIWINFLILAYLVFIPTLIYFVYLFFIIVTQFHLHQVTVFQKANSKTKLESFRPGRNIPRKHRRAARNKTTRERGREKKTLDIAGSGGHRTARGKPLISRAPKEPREPAGSSAK